MRTVHTGMSVTREKEVSAPQMVLSSVQDSNPDALTCWKLLIVFRLAMYIALPWPLWVFFRVGESQHCYRDSYAAKTDKAERHNSVVRVQVDWRMATFHSRRSFYCEFDTLSWGTDCENGCTLRLLGCMRMSELTMWFSKGEPTELL